MLITVNMDNPQPLFAQLVTQVKEAVKRGELKPGDPLPSIRQLAGDLSLNSKTVAKAYRLLERDTVIQTRGYRGTVIHPNATEHCGVDLAAWVHSQLQDAIDGYRQAGVTDSEIRVAFGQVMSGQETEKISNA